ncbi:MAG: ABC transporter permease, partial [Thermoleophilaceae bacterium]
MIDFRERRIASALGPKLKDETVGDRLRARLRTGSSTWIFLILIGLILAFSVQRPDQFASVPNFRNIAVDASVLLILGVGATYVIITAGIDLSVGSVLVFAGVVSAKAMEAIGGDGWGLIALGLAASLAGGFAWGALNGVLVAKARIPSLIVTLGTLGMALGFALVITDGVDARGVPEKLVDVGTGTAFGEIPYL